MSGFFAFLILSLIVGGIIFAVHVARKQAQARTAALRAVAGRLGWRFYGEQKYNDFDELYPQFSLFRRGHSRYAYNRLSGRVCAFDAELRVEAGDYHYKITSGSGKNRSTRTYQFSYLLVTLPFGPRLPSLRIRPENLFDKLAGAIGFEDIDFESAEFSRQWHVSSNDRRFAYALIDPRMIEFLMSAYPPMFELGAGALFIVSGGGDGRWEPAQFEAALGWTNDFMERWPSHLVTDLRNRS
jgi:hypothetical protein